MNYQNQSLFSDNLPLIIGVFLLGLLLNALLLRIIFSIPTIVRNLKSQTNLLALIARQQGIPEQEITKAILTPPEITIAS